MCDLCEDTGWVEAQSIDLVQSHDAIDSPWDTAVPPRRVAYQCDCQVQRNRDLLKRTAGVPDWARLDWWEPREGTEEAYEAVMAVIDCRGETAYRVLTLSGDFGSGKSHLAGGLAYALADGGVSVRYRYVPDLLGEIRQSIGSDQPGAADDLVDSYMRRYVLVLDDLGAGRPSTDFTREVMERIINGRYERGPLLVVTTNLKPAELTERWGRRVADRLMDDRSGNVKQVTLAAKSYRTGL